jgi:hypothetical protein
MHRQSLVSFRTPNGIFRTTVGVGDCKESMKHGCRFDQPPVRCSPYSIAELPEGSAIRAANYRTARPFIYAFLPMPAIRRRGICLESAAAHPTQSCCQLATFPEKPLNFIEAKGTLRNNAPAVLSQQRNFGQ